MTIEDTGPRPVDIDALAGALRWTIGRAPRQADEDDDRARLREVAARLGPPGAASPAELDARLDATLATMAADGVVADHCAPGHRAWMGDLALVYLCTPDDLPDRLRNAIGPTALPFLRDGATNRARAAGAVLGVDGETVRVRREPLLLEAMASALVERVARTEDRPPPPGPVPPDSRRSSWPLVLVVATLVSVTAVLTAVLTTAVTGSDDGSPDAVPATSAPDTGPATTDLGAAPPLPPTTTALGLVDGGLVAVTEGEAPALGLDDVAAVDAVRDDDRVHVTALRTDGTVAYAALGPEASVWRQVGGGATDVAVGVDTEGRAVVVAVTGGEGDLARRRLDLDGAPLEDWARLPATGVGDADVVANADGRLEVVGAFTDGRAFNVWQNEAPTGWTTNIDRRGGEDAVRVQGLTHLDGRLELFSERSDGTLWNTWQIAPGRGWRDEWDPRYVEDLGPWRVAVGAEGLLAAVAVSAEEVVLRRQVVVPQDDGRFIAQWPPSTVVEQLDLLDGARPTAATATRLDGEAVVLVAGGGRTVAVTVGIDGVGPPRELAPAEVDVLAALDG